MEKLKIKYKKKRLYVNLISAVVWLIFGLFSLYEVKETHWFDYGYLGLSAMYCSQFLYEYLNQYITIDNETIRKHAIFGKTIKLSEIVGLRKFADEYILETSSENMRINTSVIEKSSFKDLHESLASLKLPANKTFIHSQKT